MEIQEIFARNVRQLRKKASLTQEQLAEKSGFHRTYIGGIEQPGRNVSLKVLESLAEVFEVSPSKMLELEPAEKDAQSEIKEFLDDGLQPADDEGYEYALCRWEGDDLVLEPIDVQNEDLTMRVLCALAQQGSTDLARDYEQIVGVIDRFMEDREKGSRE